MKTNLSHLRHYRHAPAAFAAISALMLVATLAMGADEAWLAPAGFAVLAAGALMLWHVQSALVAQAQRLASQETATDVSSRQLDEAIEVLSEGFVMYDAEDRLVRANRKYRELYAESAQWIVPGATFEEIIRQGVRANQYEQARTNPEAWIKERLARRKATSEPFEQKLADGRWLRVSDYRTREGGMVGIRTDITELKRNMEALQNARNDLEGQAEYMKSLAEAAESASRAKSNFLATISHEIRTPMNAIMGLSDLMSECPVSAEQKHLVGAIREAGAHLLRMIDDILDFSRLESYSTALDLRPTALGDVIASVANMMDVLANKKGLALVLDVTPDLPPLVIADSSRFAQVLINLLGNAIKFTDQGGVNLTVRCVPACTPDRVGLSVTISDSGSGIPEDMRGRLFEPFERSNRHDRGQVGGTGLGLAITRKLVEAMGGAVKLKETGDHGATFEVRIDLSPCPEAHGPATADAGAPPDRPAPMRILVAEDTVASQLVIRTLLERRGHEVTMVSDGESAERLAAGGGFDLLLLDWQMPGKGGVEAARAIRALPPPLGDVPIIGLSALHSSEAITRAIEAGMDDYLTKPVLAADIDRCLAGLDKRHPMPREPAPHFEGGEDPLADLRALCTPEELVEMIDLAVVNMVEELDRLALAFTRQDHETVRAAAHKLAGLLGQYGAGTAASHARHVQQGEASTLEKEAPLLLAQSEEAIARLRAEMGRLMAA